MAINNLALRTATKHVENYGIEMGLMSEHRQAMDCRDCEAFLQLGIDAFDWIIRADQEIREAVANNQVGYPVEFETALEVLCRAWLKPCQFAAERIQVQTNRGYVIDNLDEFQRCCNEMQAIVNSMDRDDENLPESIAKLRDAALLEHANGETAEFI